MSIDPFEAARQRYEQEQKSETERLGELRATLARHGLDVGYRLLQGHGLSGRIWYATSPSRVFLGEPRLRTRAIERFVTTGDPPLRLAVRVSTYPSLLGFQPKMWKVRACTNDTMR